MGNAAAPSPDYDAALWGAAVGRRPDRRFLGVTGSAPGETIKGLLTNSLPGPLGAEIGGVSSGEVVYAALLTAKGRMITDLRAFRDPEDGFLLELPEVGADGALAHFLKFLPPRLARVEDRSEGLAVLSLMGPEVPDLLGKAGSEMGWAGSAKDISDLLEGREFVFRSSGGRVFRVNRTGDSPGESWDVLLSVGSAPELQDRMLALGAVPLTASSLEALRIERGRPGFGKDMNTETIPLEAGIQRRAVDNLKGCYVGQEVIIRIRDRGHVNKELRGFLLGDVPVPAPGEVLFRPGQDKPLGWVTSSVASPAFGQSIALGYVRRGIEPGEVLRLAGTEGSAARVRALDDEGWIMDRGGVTELG